MNEDRVRVLGNAYGTELIDRDANKGLIETNTLNVCSDHYGVQAHEIFKLVQDFTNSRREFKQIGKWFLDSEENWSLID